MYDAQSALLLPYRRVGSQAAASELTSEELFRPTQLTLQAIGENIILHCQDWNYYLTMSHSRISFIRQILR